VCGCLVALGVGGWEFLCGVLGFHFDIFILQLKVDYLVKVKGLLGFLLFVN